MLDRSKANLRLFLEKLARRRRRIACSADCYARLQKCLEGLEHKPGDSRRVPYTALREVLRTPPKGVPTELLRELVDVSRAYDSVGDGCVAIQELLDEALEVDKGILGRLRPYLPALCLLVWLLMAPAVYCPAAGWHFLDALYFGVMVTTTVGTANLWPETDGLKAWTAIYLFVAAGLLAWAVIGRAISMVIRYEARMWMSMSPRDNADLLASDGHGAPGSCALEELVAPSPRGGRPREKLGYASATLGAGVGPLAAAQQSDETSAIKEVDRSADLPLLESVGNWLATRRAPVRVTAAISVIFLVILAGSLIAFITSDDVSYLDALYWAVATCTTVGSGHVVFEPGSGSGGIVLEPRESGVSAERGLSMAFALIAVPVCFAAVLELGDVALRWRSQSLEAKLKRRALQMSVLIDLDSNGNGVSKLEFLCAAMLAEDKVSAFDIWQVLDEFHRLDPEDRGIVWADQLIALAQDPDPKLFRGAGHKTRGVQLSSGLSTSGGSASNLFGVSAVDHIGERSVRFNLRGKSTEDADVGNQPLFDELYQDALTIRRQLDAKDSELVAAVRARQATEQQLQQALAQRQGLHGEVLLLQRVKSELEGRIAQERALHEAAEKRCAEQERRRVEAERRCQDAERHLEEAERRLGAHRQQLADSQARAKDAEKRAQDAEKASLESAQRMQSYDDVWRRQVEAQAGRSATEAMNADLRRQEELRAAMLELQALHAETRGFDPDPRQSWRSTDTFAAEPTTVVSGPADSRQLWRSTDAYAELPASLPGYAAAEVGGRVAQAPWDRPLPWAARGAG